MNLKLIMSFFLMVGIVGISHASSDTKDKKEVKELKGAAALAQALSLDETDNKAEQVLLYPSGANAAALLIDKRDLACFDFFTDDQNQAGFSFEKYAKDRPYFQQHAQAIVSDCIEYGNGRKKLLACGANVQHIIEICYLKDFLLGFESDEKPRDFSWIIYERLSEEIKRSQDGEEKKENWSNICASVEALGEVLDRVPYGYLPISGLLEQGLVDGIAMALPLRFFGDGQFSPQERLEKQAYEFAMNSLPRTMGLVCFWIVEELHASDKELLDYVINHCPTFKAVLMKMPPFFRTMLQRQYHILCSFDDGELGGMSQAVCVIL